MDKSSLRRVVWMILFTASFLGVVVLANTWKGDLKVTDIRVEGNQIVGDEEVLRLAGIKNGDSLFGVDLFKAQARVQKNLFVKSVSAKREVPNCIVLSIVERVPIVGAVVDRVHFLDNEGFILPPAPPGVVTDLPIITGKLDKNQFAPGKQVGSTSIREAVGIVTVAREISDELYRSISEIHIDGDKSVVFYTAEYGVPVMFGHGDIDGKLLKFNAFWKTFVIYRGSHVLRYVDLRFENQVVVRWKPDDRKAPSASNIPMPSEKHTPVAMMNLASTSMTSQQGPQSLYFVEKGS